MVSHAHAAHTDTTSELRMPIPKINIPPAQFFLKEEEEAAVVVDAAPHLDITQENFNPHTPLAWNAPRDIRFTCMVITLVVGINVCIAWLLGSSVDKNDITQQEDRILMQPMTPTQEKSPSTSSEKLQQPRAALEVHSENSVYLSKEDRKMLLQRLIATPATTDAEISANSQ